MVSVVLFHIGIGLPQRHGDDFQRRGLVFLRRFRFLRFHPFRFLRDLCRRCGRGFLHGQPRQAPPIIPDLESVPQLDGVREIVLCGLYGVLVDLGCVVVGDMCPQFVQRQVAATHTVVHGQHFQRFLCDPRRIVENVGDHVHRPAVAQHFIRLGV